MGGWGETLSGSWVKSFACSGRQSPDSRQQTGRWAAFLDAAALGMFPLYIWAKTIFYLM